MKYVDQSGKQVTLSTGLTHYDPLFGGQIGPATPDMSLREFSAICVANGFKNAAEMAVIYCCLFSESGAANGLRAFEKGYLLLNIPEALVLSHLKAKHGLKLITATSKDGVAKVTSTRSTNSFTWTRINKSDQLSRWADVFALASVLNSAQRETLISVLALGLGQTLGETAKRVLKFQGTYQALLGNYYTKGAPYQAAAAVAFISRYMAPEVRAGKLSIVRMKYEGGPATQARSKRGLAILKRNATNKGYPERMGAVFANVLATTDTSFSLEKQGPKVAKAVASEIITAPSFYV